MTKKHWYQCKRCRQKSLSHRTVHLVALSVSGEPQLYAHTWCMKCACRHPLSSEGPHFKQFSDKSQAIAEYTTAKLTKG